MESSSNANGDGPGKGALAPGMDADLALVQLGPTRTLSREELRYAHPQCPYIGRTLRARVLHTFLRGHCVYADGKLVGAPAGRFIAPQKPSR